MKIDIIMQYNALELLNGDHVGDLYTEVEKSILIMAMDDIDLAQCISDITGIHIAYFNKKYPRNILEDDRMWISAMHKLDGNFDFNPNDLSVSGYEGTGDGLMIEYKIPVIVGR